MMYILPLIAGLILGWRYPGLIAAGVLFTYPASVLSGAEGVSALYAIASVAILGAKHLVERHNISLSYLDLAVAFFMSIVFASTMWGPARLDGVPISLKVISAILAPYIISRLTFNIPDRESRAKECVAALILLGLAYGLAVQITAEQFVNNRIAIGNAEGVAVGITQAFVAVVVAAVPLLFEGSLAQIPRKALVALTILVASLVILDSGTRGAFVAIFLGILFYVFYARAWRFMSSGKVLLLAWVALILILLFPNTDLTFLTENRIFQFESYGSQTDRSSLARRAQFEAAVQLFAEQPSIGRGIGSYDYLTGLDYPHNIFLEVAAELGLLGLFSLILIIHLVVRGFESTPKSSVYLLSICAVIVAGFFHHQLSYSLHMGKTLFMIGCFSVPFGAKYKRDSQYYKTRSISEISKDGKTRERFFKRRSRM